MNPVERVLRGVDRVQRKNRVAGFGYGVIKKFGDDRGGSLAAVLAYYAFVSLFPMLLVIITVLGFVLHGDKELQRDLIDSALADFPVVGNQLENNVTALGGNGLALAIGLAASLWGALGVTQAAQYAMAEVWDVPELVRPGFFPRLGRGVLLFTILGLGVIATTVLAGFGMDKGVGLFGVANLLVTMLLNVGLFSAGYRILTPKQIGTSKLLPGAVVAGIAWTLLQLLGTYLISNQLRHTSEVYGFFAIVLGLLWWLYLASLITVYASEISVVLSKRLWPRSLVRPPLTGADRRALRDAVAAKQRVPMQAVHVRFGPHPAPDDEPEGDR